MTEPTFLFERAMPVAAVKDSSLNHNVGVMADYCRTHEVDLAPHVKTTMSPEIYGLQREAGAWAATVATVDQADVVRSWGQSRILIAAQVVDPGGLRRLIEATDSNPELEIVCWLDSAEGLSLLESEHRHLGARRPVRVAVEVGHPNGRTGLRAGDSALELARAAAASRAVALTGVAAFEGTIAGPGDIEAEVDKLVGSTRSLFEAADSEGLFADTPALVTLGGSAYFDRVTRGLAGLGHDRARVVLRSGCYVTHDCGVYDELSPLGSHGENLLRPALEIWSAVLSTPQEGLAVANIGKRDASHDAGLPRVVKLRKPGDGQAGPIEVSPRSGIEITSLNDQHAFVADPNSMLSVGDLIGVCISHPCTTFDKWSRLALIDDNYRVVGSVRTEFP